MPDDSNQAMIALLWTGLCLTEQPLEALSVQQSQTSDYGHTLRLPCMQHVPALGLPLLG